MRNCPLPFQPRRPQPRTKANRPQSTPPALAAGAEACLTQPASATGSLLPGWCTLFRTTYSPCVVFLLNETDNARTIRWFFCDGTLNWYRRPARRHLRWRWFLRRVRAFNCSSSPYAWPPEWLIDSSPHACRSFERETWAHGQALKLWDHRQGCL